MRASLAAHLVLVAAILAASIPCSQATTHQLHSPRQSPSNSGSPHKPASLSPHRTSSPRPSKLSPSHPKHSPAKRSPSRPKRSPSLPKRSVSPLKAPFSPRKHSPTPGRKGSPAAPHRSPSPVKQSSNPPQPSCFPGMYIKCNDPAAPQLMRTPAALLAPASATPTLLPNDGSVTTIGAGKAYYLAGTYNLSSLTVYGRLTCGPPSLPPTPISLTTQALIINGAFHCGTPRTPYTANVTITLTGLGSVDGTKSIMVAGNISLHGTRRSTWTSIATTITPTDTTFTTLHPVDWQPGELIVVSSTSFSMYEYEERTIASVAPSADGGTTITVTTPFDYNHWGALQWFMSPDGHNWKLDERAQVALLDRNIVIQGDDSWATSKVGAQVTIANGGHAWVHSVKFTRMGELGVLGTYPLHYHLLGDRQGDYAISCVVYKSYNRCFTIHGTDNVLLERNVCHDHVGHGYFLEDACEIGNKYRYNLGMTTRKPASLAQATVETDFQKLATFWIANPLNHFVGNVAAGSDFAGFWMVTPASPINSCQDAGMKSGITPSRMSLGLYEHNVAHTCVQAFVIDGGICSGTRSPFCGGDYFLPGLPQTIRNLTTYKNSGIANWLNLFKRVDLRSCTFADGPFMLQLLGQQVIFNSLFVGQSANILSHEAVNKNILKRASGMTLYDGAPGIIDSFFAGYSSPLFAAISLFTTFGRQWPFFVQNIQFAADTPITSRLQLPGNFSQPNKFCVAVQDITGSITDVPNSVIVPALDPNAVKAPSVSDVDFMALPACTRETTQFNGYICPGTMKIGTIYLWHYYTDPAVCKNGCPKGVVDISRSDGPSLSADSGGYLAYIQFNVIVSASIDYTVRYRAPESLVWSNGAPWPFWVRLGNVRGGASVNLTLTNLPTNGTWLWSAYDCYLRVQYAPPTSSDTLSFTLTAVENPASPSGPYPNNLAGGLKVWACPGSCRCT